MLPLHCRVQVKARAPRYNVLLMGNVIAQHILKSKLLRLAFGNGDHVHAEGHLKVGIFIKVLQYLSRVRILFDLYNGPHAHSVGFIAYVAYTGEHGLLFLRYLQYAFKCAGLVHLIGHFGCHYQLFAVLLLLYVALCAHGKLAAARFVGGAYFIACQYVAAGWEIGAGDYLHKLVKVYVRLFHLRNNGIYSLGKVMRRYGRCKAHGYAVRAVYKQVREAAGQHVRLLFRIVKVKAELYRVLIYVAQQLKRKRCHPCLGIAHCGGAVAVYAAEVAVPVHKRRAHIEILRHTHHCVIYAGIPVRVIFTQAVAHYARAFPVRLIGRVAKAEHCVKYSALHGLQPVLNAGQGAFQYYMLGIGQHGFVHNVVHALCQYVPIRRNGRPFVLFSHLP